MPGTDSTSIPGGLSHCFALGGREGALPRKESILSKPAPAPQGVASAAGVTDGNLPSDTGTVPVKA